MCKQDIFFWKVIRWANSKVIGSPLSISTMKFKAIWKGSHDPILKGDLLTMVINHLLNGMILQEPIGWVCITHRLVGLYSRALSCGITGPISKEKVGLYRGFVFV